MRSLLFRRYTPRFPGLVDLMEELLRVRVVQVAKYGARHSVRSRGSLGLVFAQGREQFPIGLGNLFSANLLVNRLTYRLIN